MKRIQRAAMKSNKYHDLLERFVLWVQVEAKVNITNLRNVEVRLFKPPASVVETVRSSIKISTGL